MINNNVFHSQPLSTLSQSVNRSQKELTITCRWSSFDVSTLANTDDAISELYLGGFPVVSTVPNPSDSSAKLFPLTNHMDKIAGKRGALIHLYFYPMSVQSSGGEGYTALQINDAIKNSTSVAGMGYNQTVIRNSAMVSHQPNWFRPKFVINQNLDYFNLDSTSGEYPTASPTGIFKPEFAQGMNLPFEEVGNFKALKIYETIDEIDVYAQCYQAIKIESDWVYQRYPVFCEARFIIED